MSAGLVASTVTPGTIAPVVSVTWPAIAPCANAMAGNRRMPRPMERDFRLGNPGNIRRLRMDLTSSGTGYRIDRLERRFCAARYHPASGGSTVSFGLCCPKPVCLGRTYRFLDPDDCRLMTED